LGDGKSGGREEQPGALYAEGDFWAVAEPQAALEAATRSVVARVRRDIAWYDRKAKVQKRWSWGLRVGAVLLGIAGGLCPLLPVGEARGWVVPFGYVFLALAAGLVVLDQAFGFSSTWMRFTIAQLRLRRAFDRSQLELLAARTGPDAAGGATRLAAQVDVLKLLLAATDDVVLGETEAWMAEFKIGLLRIEQLAAGRQEDGRAGHTTAGPVTANRLSRT
jgi:hypothetical protein